METESFKNNFKDIICVDSQIEKNFILFSFYHLYWLCHWSVWKELWISHRCLHGWTDMFYTVSVLWVIRGFLESSLEGAMYLLNNILTFLKQIHNFFSPSVHCVTLSIISRSWIKSCNETCSSMAKTMQNIWHGSDLSLALLWKPKLFFLLWVRLTMTIFSWKEQIYFYPSMTKKCFFCVQRSIFYCVWLKTKQKTPNQPIKKKNKKAW